MTDAEGSRLSALPTALAHLTRRWHLLDKKWISRRQDKRQLAVTEIGRAGFAEVFEITP